MRHNLTRSVFDGNSNDVCGTSSKGGRDRGAEGGHWLAAGESNDPVWCRGWGSAFIFHSFVFFATLKSCASKLSVCSMYIAGSAV